MVEIQVPATSANLGSGFDCAGIALSLYNRVSMEEWDGILVESADGAPVPVGEDNLVASTVKKLYKTVGKTFRGVHMIQQSDIPQARGLGSSSACIAAGLVGANELLGSPMTRQALSDLAVSMEGHPDNILPAFYGGFIVAAMDGNRTVFTRAEMKDDLLFAAFVPPFEMKTSFARKILPQTLSLTDAVFNMSRTALLTAAFVTGDYTHLKTAMQDKLHQQHRLPLITGAEELMALSESLGALASYLSGAGSTILSVIEKSNEEFFEKAAAALQENAYGYSLLKLRGDNKGVCITGKTE